MEKLDMDKLSEMMKLKSAAVKGYEAGYAAAVLDIQKKLGKHVISTLKESAEAGVLKKMEELKQIEISERDRKIVILAAASVAGLIICTVFFARKHKKKRLIVKVKAETVSRDPEESASGEDVE